MQVQQSKSFLMTNRLFAITENLLKQKIYSDSEYKLQFVENNRLYNYNHFTDTPVWLYEIKLTNNSKIYDAMGTYYTNEYRVGKCKKFMLPEDQAVFSIDRSF